MKYLKERKEVLFIAQQIFKQEMVLGTWGNVSQRINNEPLLLITPSGLDYTCMSLEDLVLLDLNEQCLEGNRTPSTETPLHIEIYRQRPDVGAIVHVHSNFASAFAVAGKCIPVILEETAQVVGHPIAVAPYATCGTAELAIQTVKTLGEGRAVLLANHGLVAVGKDLATALKICTVAEKTARVCIYANSLGQINELSPANIAALQEQYQHYGQTKD